MPPECQRRVQLAHRIRAQRKYRIKYFGPSVGQDVPWDILMVLFANDGGLKITSVQADVGGSPTTALRWLQRLEELGFIHRHEHPNDRRIVNIALTPLAREMLSQFLDECPHSTQNEAHHHRL